jgi:hypothetical protein
MTNKLIKSLQNMDDYLDSVTDEKFLEDYLSVENQNGPLLKHFLEEYSFSEEKTYTVYGESVDLSSQVSSRQSQLYAKNIESCSYDIQYAANDNNYSLAA